MRRRRRQPRGSRCRRPTRGWYCLLVAGHPGPCPAWPSTSTRVATWLRGRPERREEDRAFRERAAADARSGPPRPLP
jgi:hypothetical protein